MAMAKVTGTKDGTLFVLLSEKEFVILFVAVPSTTTALIKAVRALQQPQRYFKFDEVWPHCSAIPSSVHFAGVARARARRGRISLESETGRVLTV